MKKQFFIQYTLTILILLILIIAWEFLIEENAPNLIFKESVQESNDEHWEYVFTVGIFGAIALIVPTIISVWHANKRRQAELKVALINQVKERELHEEHLRRILVSQELEVQKKRLEVFKATMRTVQDIVGNFLNSLQLIRVMDNDPNVLESDSLELMDSMINETSAQLTKLSNLDTIHEKQMAIGVGIDYEETVNDESCQSQSAKYS